MTSPATSWLGGNPGLKVVFDHDAADVAAALDLALAAAGLAQTAVAQRPRLLSDNGPSYRSGQRAAWLAEHAEKPDSIGALLLAGAAGSASGRVRHLLQQPPLPRAPEQAHPADICFGRAQTLLARRQKLKLNTIELRRRLHHQRSPKPQPDGINPL